MPLSKHYNSDKTVQIPLSYSQSLKRLENLEKKIEEVKHHCSKTCTKHHIVHKKKPVQKPKPKIVHMKSHVNPDTIH